MSEILVVYHSRTGNTEKMAGYVAEGVKDEGSSVDLRSVDAVEPVELKDYDGVVMGSPTYYGGMAAELKKLVDESVQLHGQLKDMVGGAFSSSAHVGGGNETTALDIVHALLIHGMVVPGIHDGDHYGTTSVNQPDDRVERQCKELGRRVAGVARELGS